jgi:hypothetical protein
VTAYSLDHCWTFTTHTPTQHSDVLGDTHWFQHLWTENTGLNCQLQTCVHHPLLLLAAAPTSGSILTTRRIGGVKKMMEEQ